MFLNLLRRLRVYSPIVEESGGGGAVTDEVQDTSVQDAGGEAAEVKPDPKPATMLDAINQHFATTEQAEGKPDRARDEKGRFAQGEVAKPEQKATDKAKVEPDKAKPAQEDAQMPEGLSPKAQQRFQQLAAAVKERDQQLASAQHQIEYVKTSFQEHGVTREQFEQATSFIGAINRGNYRDALRILDQQRQQLALALGEPLPGVDALADFPDLRQRVDQLQMTEADAIELARLRKTQQTQQAQAEQAQQAQTQQAEQQQLVQKATGDVDAWCRQMAANDLDWPAIEEKILPHVQALLGGVHPSRWVETLQAQYQLAKSIAQTNRPQASSGTVLRPTGGGAVTSAPKTAFEAMWGKPLPA